ncbi:MAG: rRNA maturation RNase YbeY [Planctomycetaceae bacterium]|jgi:probable rRNA maturation factor|nr:rRNA maturation RNase YbeY [Planctomycetaceae bacterium]
MQSFTVNVIDEQNLLCLFSKNAKHKQKITITLKTICHQILDDANISCGHLNIAIVNGETMLKYNAKFLGHDYVTDVISFQVDYKETNKNGNVQKYLEGDIIVCADTAIERANEFNWSPLEEFFLYAIHGSLHLVGYDDKKTNSKKTMRKKESEYIKIVTNTFKLFTF